MSTPIALSADPLDRCDALRKQEGEVEKLQQQADALYLVVVGDQLLVDDSGALSVVNSAILPELTLNSAGVLFLGIEPKTMRPWFAIGPEPTITANLDILETLGQLIALRPAMASMPLSDLAIAGRAISLFNWHLAHRFCAGCGLATISTFGGEKRKCPACQREHFPRVDPAVIMMVVDGDSCLLGRNANWPAGVYSTLAGFVEPGESFEEACRREVMEEVGILVGKVSYQFSQPWPFPHTMMVGLVGEALSTKITLEDELESARWFCRDEAISMLDGTHNEVAQPFARAASGVLLRQWALGNLD